LDIALSLSDPAEARQRAIVGTPSVSDADVARRASAVDTAHALSTTTQSDELLGHPKGLYVCFLTEMWERFAFYAIKALMFLYLVNHHKFADGDGYLLVGTYAGLAYALPLIGGMLADRWLGMRKAVVFGGLLLVFGQFGMVYTGSLQVMYMSLALISVGVGFLKPNISTIVGKLYRDDDPRRDSGFTIFYMGINIGATLSGLTVGYIGIEWGWGYGFGLSGALMVLGLGQFLWGQRHLHGHAEPRDPAALRQPFVAGLSTEHLIYIGGLLTTVAVWQILQIKLDLGPLSALVGGHEVTLTELIAVVMGSSLFVWFVWFLFSGISARERGQMIVLMTLLVISALFWGLYEQTYTTWMAYSERVMDRRMLGFEPTASQLTSVGALFVVTLTPLFAWLWPLLDRLRLNPNAVAKFGLGLVFAGVAFGVLVYATDHPNSTGLVSVWWLVLAYLVLVFGEMVLSPIGLSAVTTLAVPRVVGLMMGAWFLFSAFGEIIAGRFGTWAEVEPEADGSFAVTKAMAVYADVFGDLMWIGLASGIAMLVVSPFLARLTRESSV
jgi:POT family proton-dependent oligopeptide transporter